MHDLPIVMYHNIRPPGSPDPSASLAFSPDQFRAHLRFFRDQGYRTLTLPQVWEALAGGNLGQDKSVVLTFDDGYLDNLTVAAGILRQFGMCGTIFVNPEFTGPGTMRDHPGRSGILGYLDFAELRKLQSEGLFDIWIFSSDDLVDLYTPDKFDRYYWLAWMLDPSCKPDWPNHIAQWRHDIPSGFPIFRHQRALAGPRFTPDPAFVRDSVTTFARSGMAGLQELAGRPGKGWMEPRGDYEARVEHELVDSRLILQGELSKPVEFLCFPGGVYRPEHLLLAARAGYKACMASIRDQRGSNERSLLRHPLDTPVVLKRISFTKDYPSALSCGPVEYLNCMLKVEAYEGARLASGIMGCLKGVRRLAEGLSRSAR